MSVLSLVSFCESRGRRVVLLKETARLRQGSASSDLRYRGSGFESSRFQSFRISGA